MSVTTLPIWRLRAAREAPRYLMLAAAAAGLLASARFAIAPPHAQVPPAAGAENAPDLAAEQFAVMFARRYLTWSAEQPEAALPPGLTGALEPDAGFVAPAHGEQHVEWAEVVQARVPATGEHVYTVAAQTDSAGLVYLSVSVARSQAGALELAGYPAFVGPPDSAPALATPRLRDVADPALTAVVSRALRNYLTDSPAELAADLSSTARVSLPSAPLALTAVTSVRWEPDGRSVQAVIQARDSHGGQYTLAYELDVAVRQGRWEVSAVQTDPTA